MTLVPAEACLKLKTDSEVSYYSGKTTDDPNVSYSLSTVFEGKCPCCEFRASIVLHTKGDGKILRCKYYPEGNCKKGN
jgi:hypothetical protein